MNYYVEHGAHYINVSEHSIARYYYPIKCLNSAVTYFKSARELCMYVCVRMCLDVYVLFCRLYTRT